MITTTIRNYLAFVLLLLFHSVCFSQYRNEIFKDLNEEIKPTSISKLSICQDSILYFTSREYVFRAEDSQDTLNIYGTDGDSTFLVKEFANGDVNFINPDERVFFKHKSYGSPDESLYVINDNYSTFVTNMSIASEEQTRFQYKRKLFFKRSDVNPRIETQLWVTDGTPEGTFNFFTLSTPSIYLSFIGACGDYIYFSTINHDSNTYLVWKIDYYNNQVTFISSITDVYLYADKHPKTLTNFFIFYGGNKLYIINNFTNELKEYSNLIINSKRKFINNHYYFGQYEPNTNLSSLYRLNINNLEIERVKSGFTLYEINYQNKNLVYMSGHQPDETQYDLYKTDTLFQNLTKVQILQVPPGGIGVQSLFFKDDIYVFQSYSNTNSYYRYNFRTVRYSPQNEQCQVIFDSVSDGLHKSYFEMLNVTHAFVLKKYFLFTLYEDRSNWGSQNSFVGDFIWKSNGTHFVKMPNLSRNTLSSGVFGINAFQNDIFFFADENNGYVLYTTDASKKNLRKFIDTTFVGDGLSIPRSKIYKVGGKLFFTLGEHGYSRSILVCTSGNKESTKFVLNDIGDFIYNPDELKALGNYLYYRGGDYSLYRTNGDLTERIFASSYYVNDFLVKNNSVYFITRTGNTISTLWRRDDNSTENYLLFQTGSVFSVNFSKFLGIIGDKIIFYTYENGCSIYALDINNQSIVLIKNFNTNSILESLLFKNKIYFYDSYNSSNLWHTDGTSEGTKIIYSGFNAGGRLVATNDFMFFWGIYWIGNSFTFSPVISDGVNHKFLYQSINSPENYEMNNVYSTANSVFFQKNNKTYVTNGLEENTYLFSNEIISDVMSVGDYIFYVKNTKKYGTELWWIHDCKDLLNLNGINNKDNILVAKKNIISSQIVENAKIVYRAGDSILLSPGFETRRGGFKAEIEGCEY